MSARSLVDVAVGVVFAPDGKVLLCCRPEGKPYAGYWEFPGGKLEAGESVLSALQRELREELGIEVRQAQPWLIREFEYPHAHVRLHFWRVSGFDGEATGLEGQQLAWVSVAAAQDLSPLLPATIPVLRWLSVPTSMAISNAAAVGPEAFLERAQQRLHAGRLPWLLLREPDLDSVSVRGLHDQLRLALQPFGARLSVSTRHREALSDVPEVNWHFTAADLMRCEHKPATEALLGASCHNLNEVRRVSALGLDYAVLSPVKPTASHPDSPTLGWDGFSELAPHAGAPVLALGGLGLDDGPQAQEFGAHGVACLSAAWR